MDASFRGMVSFCGSTSHQAYPSGGSEVRVQDRLSYGTLASVAAP